MATDWPSGLKLQVCIRYIGGSAAIFKPVALACAAAAGFAVVSASTRSLGHFVMVGDQVLAQLADLISSPILGDGRQTEGFAELQQIEVDLVGDQERELFNMFVAMKNEMELLLMHMQLETWLQRKARIVEFDLDVIASARRRLLEVARDQDQGLDSSRK